MLASTLMFWNFTPVIAMMGMGRFMDPWYLLLVMLPGMVLSSGAAWLVKKRFNQYSSVPTSRGFTGQQAAQKLLDTAGITDVRVVRVDGTLTDHYNPTNKTLALSSQVFDKSSVAAIGVATHEAGHAIQHATGYFPLKWRSMIVPAANIGTKFGTTAMMVGLALIAVAGVFGQVVFLIGAGLYTLLLLFQLVTLPVEFNASNRAKQLVVEAGIVTPQERVGIDKVLTAAAMTYVAAFVTAFLTLIYFLHRAGFFNNRR